MPSTAVVPALLIFAASMAESDAQAPAERRSIQTQRMLEPHDGMEEGRAHALTYCQSCHLFVEPEQLIRSIWEEKIIPRMGGLLGMHHAGYDYSREFMDGKSDLELALIERADVYPQRALVPKAHWDKLVDYLLANAPPAPASPKATPEINSGSMLLKATPLALPRSTPTTTFIHIDEQRQELLIGDMGRQSLVIADSTGRVKHDIWTGNTPIAVRRRAGELWITGIGSFLPSDVPQGDLLVFTEIDGTYRFDRHGWKLGQLSRPTHAAYGDLNADGIEDVVMSEFGNLIGQLVWYEGIDRRPGDDASPYVRHVLLSEPGSITSYLHDFDADGLNDIAAVFGQGREGVHIFYNAGDGTFERSYALQVPPTFGSTYFELHDFDGDGHIDILATHGDNGDYPPFPKRYHGVRIYVNDGRGLFEERYFFHMNGAYKAIARDFDADGDLDIAAISMFPDFEKRPEEGFVYLEQTGEFRFDAHTVAEVSDGRWLTMDAGDLDGDGDADVVLGSFAALRTNVPAALGRKWDAGSPNVLLLTNQLKSAPHSGR